jgi:hypothetical protein
MIPLQAEAAVMKFGEHPLGTVQFNHRADPRGDRAICGHAHKHVQPVRFEAEFPVKRAATWIVDCCDISFHLINFQAGRFEDVVQKHVGENLFPVVPPIRTCSISFRRAAALVRFAARMLQLHTGIRPQMLRT